MDQSIYFLFFIPPILMLASIFFQKWLSKKVDLFIRIFFSIMMLLFVMLVLLDII